MERVVDDIPSSIRLGFGESSRSYTDLLNELGLNTNAIVKAVLTVMKRRK